MYLRFVRQVSMSGARSREGFFAAAYELRDDNTLDEHTRLHLDELLSWFRGNLAIPGKFSRSSSKGSYRNNATPGISWFKANASEHMDKAYELKALLDLNGHSIDILKTVRPGYIVYQDDHQIVAEPFTDNRWFE